MIMTKISELGGDKRWKKRHGYVIYSLVNLDNGKRYIGRTKNPVRRLQSHFYGIKTHRHPNRLVNAESDCRFGFEILSEGLSYEIGLLRERRFFYHFKTYDPSYGYNVLDPYVRGSWTFLEMKRKKDNAKSLYHEKRETERKVSGVGLLTNET